MARLQMKHECSARPLVRADTSAPEQASLGARHPLRRRSIPYGGDHGPLWSSTAFVTKAASRPVMACCTVLT